MSRHRITSVLLHVPEHFPNRAGRGPPTVTLLRHQPPSRSTHLLAAQQRLPLPPQRQIRVAKSQHENHGRSQRRSASSGPRPYQQPRMMRGPSINALQQRETQKMMREGEIPDDLGLLPRTFVMPTGRNRPSWSSGFRARFRLEKTRFLVKLQDLVYLIYFRYFAIRPRPNLGLRDAISEARSLHTKMYRHFAYGNLEPIADLLCNGLRNSLHARIESRPAGTRLRWQTHGDVQAPRVISVKSVVFPNRGGGRADDKERVGGVMQVVVRIHSRQSLQHIRHVKTGAGVVEDMVVDRASGRRYVGVAAEEHAASIAKPTAEYIVLQRTLKRSVLGPWMVWGSVEETTPESWARQEGLAARQSRGRADGAGGGGKQMGVQAG